MAPGSERDAWLKVVVEQMQESLAELKLDVKKLLEERAEQKGKTYVIVAIVSGISTIFLTIVTNFLIHRLGIN